MKQQGDAAFWWNLKRSGDGDDSTRHAGCPVLVGSKWGKISKYVFICDINLLLTERQGRTGEYWPELVAVPTERSEVRTKTSEGIYLPVRLEQASLVSRLLYGSRPLNFPLFKK